MEKRFCGHMKPVPAASSMKQILSIIIWVFKVNNKTIFQLNFVIWQ